MTAPNLGGLMKFAIVVVATVLFVSDYAESAARRSSRAEQIAIAQDNEANADVLIPAQGTEVDAQTAAAAAKRRSLAKKRRQYSYQAALSAQQSASQSSNSASSFYAGSRRRGGKGLKKRNIFDYPMYPNVYDDYDQGELDDPYAYEFRKKKRRKRANRKRRG